MNDSTEPKVSLEHAAQAYRVGTGLRPVLTDVSLQIRTNESVAVIGPTGVGKSTLLRLIAGFEAPTEGRALVRMNDRMAPASPSPEIGYLFQQPALFPWMTVRDNVLFGARNAHTYGADTAALRENADRYIDLVGLTDAVELFPYQISGGMRARTALARVFLTRPQVLLMDEPFGALDALTRREMYSLLRELVATSPELTTVMVTHDVDEAISLCETVVVISGIPGTVSDVYRSELSGLSESIDSLQQEPDYIEFKAALLDTLARRRSETRSTAAHPE